MSRKKAGYIIDTICAGVTFVGIFAVFKYRVEASFDTSLLAGMISSNMYWVVRVATAVVYK